MNPTDYARVEQTIRYLDRHFHRQPGLAELAAQVHLSEYHFQRLFRRWAGVSPKRFLQYLTADYVKARLRDAATVLEAADGAGLSSGGRVHELLVTLHAVTPGEWKSEGEGLVIRYGYAPTRFGECLVAATDRGICALHFAPDPSQASLDGLRAQWPRARFVERPGEARAIARRVFGSGGEPLALHVGGSNFQIKVWEALLTVPAGRLVSYDELARRAGRPGAARAVGTAVGANPVAVLIPCHRVIRKTGAFGEYRWGDTRKRALLAWEAARANQF
ncbi:6-O-methylguanine DNA methyltransferase [Sulfurifustis variabilis]|uniref:methylated-DNA--[protein]-cysteine S-methyltransferase n=1 Tax=Sulfurifustis variabilis TaxID=1675686 RepID=A0A1B4UZU0_9GAMM|nr:methylated-DNA--[protein]-cysteine S-methyltransferase [Sulfurifustis variabilis]BAU46668.1 6-O-methylguanine DNA methyltransferase [Sulfurifustis variabilis]